MDAQKAAERAAENIIIVLKRHGYSRQYMVDAIIAEFAPLLAAKDAANETAQRHISDCHERINALAAEVAELRREVERWKHAASVR